MALRYHQLGSQTLVIPITTSTSGAFSNPGVGALGLLMPAAFTGTAITFTVCQTLGGTYVALYNASGQVSVNVAAGRAYALPADLLSWPFFKIVSNGTEAAARTLIVTEQL